MQRMLDLVKKKQISCVIVKDFSRFSRDHIEQGKYIEQIFPFMGVRFIAINDNYDSADYVGGIGEIDVAFKGILYDFFSEEQSSKVSLTLDTKRGNGKYIATYAPYGYVKSPEDKHKLVVDEFASQIVKRIFKEFLSGKSMYKISEGLNRDGIDTPGVYIAMQVGSEKQLARYREKKPLWNNVAIGRILGNEQYTGTMIYSRFKIENVGDKHAKALPEDEWKRVENCHEAIISKEDFEKVAAMRKENTCASAKRKHDLHRHGGKGVPRGRAAGRGRAPASERRNGARRQCAGLRQNVRRGILRSHLQDRRPEVTARPEERNETIWPMNLLPSRPSRGVLCPA